jgi:hypothetical protein
MAKVVKRKKKPITDTFELVAFPKVRIPLHAKRISTLELAKLTFLNSDDIPKAVVVMKPRRMEWVGIGWIDCGEPRGDEVVVIPKGEQ